MHNILDRLNLTAIQWKDIDFNGRFITIERSLSKGKIETPKSGQSRKVDMSQQLTNILRELKHHRKVETLKRGWTRMPEWVFVTLSGEPYHESFIRGVFYKALNKASLRKIRIHDLRHAYATLRISKGDNIADVSKQLGHHSVKFTMDIYYHWVPGGSKSEVDGLDELGSVATIRNLSATKEKGISYPFPRYIAKSYAEIITNIHHFPKEGCSEFPPLLANSPIFPTKDCQFHQAG